MRSRLHGWSSNGRYQSPLHPSILPLFSCALFVASSPPIVHHKGFAPAPDNDPLDTLTYMLVSALTTSATQFRTSPLHVYLCSFFVLPFEMSSQVDFHPSRHLTSYSISDLPASRGFPGTTFSLRSFAYLSKHPTVYQERFSSIYSHPSFHTFRPIPYPCARVACSPLRTSQLEIQNGAYQCMIPYRIYGPFHCGVVLPIARSLISCLPIIASQAHTLSA